MKNCDKQKDSDPEDLSEKLEDLDFADDVCF